MYVNPVFIGVAATIAIELLALVVAAIVKGSKK